MRGPGGWVRSKRVMAIEESPTKVIRKKRRSARDLRRRNVVDDPLAVGVDAKGNERPVAHYPEGMHPVCGYGDRDPGFHHHYAFFAVEPSLAPPFDDGQDLGVRMRVRRRRVSRLRGLNTGADR